MGADDAVWPLTGRDGELAEIEAALRTASGVLLAGPAGVGKTRLARGALTRHAAGLTRWLTATGSAQGVPLAALAPLLGPSDGEPDGASLLVRAHAALRGEPNLVLGVDDAHLLDDVSATLLHQAATERTVRLVVTVRTGEKAPDAITALWKDGWLTRVDLAPLSAPETGALVGAVLGGRLDGDSARRLHHATSGNPLWLRHLVHGELLDGRFCGTAGVWRWDGVPRLSPALATLIDAEIGQLPHRVAEVLELLAVGEPLGVGLLTDLIGGLEVEESVARKLVAVQAERPGTAARLAHPLYGQAVLNRCGPVRARRRRGQLVAALAGSGYRDAGGILRLAVLALDSDREPDPALFAAAASAAAEVTDVKLAERLARAACEAGGGFEIRLLLGLLLSWQYKTQEAAREYTLANQAANTDTDRVRVAYCLAFNHVVLGQAQQTRAVLDAAALGSPWAERQLRAFHAILAGWENRLAEAEAAARQVLTIADRSSQAETYAGWVLSAALALAGRLTEAREIATRAVAAALRAPETAALQLNIRYWEVLALALAGLPDELRGDVDGLRAHLTGRFHELFLPIFDGWHALVSGRVGPAAALLSEFRPHLPGHGGGWTSLIEPAVALAHGMSGNAAGAEEALRRANELRHPTIRVQEPLVILAEAWAAAAAGAISPAVKHARRAAGLAGQSGQYAVEVLARHAAVEFGDRAQPSRLTELARHVEGPRASAAAVHARALRDGDPAALLVASEQLAAAGLLLPAAEAAAQAAVLEDPPGPLVGTAARRAAELAERCPGARTPALVAAAHPLPITDREREVATLTVGLSNREIAERLGVSVRTVEGHVYRACVKLGVRDRTALANLVAGSG